MNLDSFKYLANFDFVEYFGIVAHTVKLDNSQWITNQILDSIDQGFRSIKWTYCDDNTVIVNINDNIGDSICLCEKHSEELGISSKEIVYIDKITNEFKNRVKNIDSKKSIRDIVVTTWDILDQIYSLMREKSKNISFYFRKEFILSSLIYLKY